LFRTLVILAILFHVLISVGYTQEYDKDEIKKLTAQANSLFDNEEFYEALPLYLKLDSLIENDFETKYYIGACYLNTKYQKTKGIPYLEFAIEHGENLLPPDVFYDLGVLYHIDYQFERSVAMFEKYLEIAYKDEENRDHAKRYIVVCDNAKNITSNEIKLGIKKIGPRINTDNSELDPHVSADESIMYFTRTSIHAKDGVITDSLCNIYISYNESGYWSEPEKLNIPLIKNRNGFSIAGISPDGSKMYILLENQNKNIDIYSCEISDNQCKNLSRLPDKINSIFNEGRASITADGSELYFSSDREGGYGGKDIYKIIRYENGDWSEPYNLGPIVNSIYDEDAPFIHPDKKTLYFSSKGHHTIGGYDIFRSVYNYFDNTWSKPINVGFPINSTSDDLGFSLSAEGTTGYFSSSQGNTKELHDIYRIDIDQSIPLTLVKGTITAGSPPKPISAHIRVYDNETKERVKYIYDPSPETGKYLMIFPPGKNYNMIIEAKGFLPRNVNIYVPNQTYFHELFQKIHLSPIIVESTGEVVGEEITVKNTFYDLFDPLEADSVFSTKKSQKDYSELLDLIDELIEKTDTIGIQKLDFLSSKTLDTISHEKDRYEEKNFDELVALIENAIETTDSTTLTALNMSIAYDEDVNDKYYYGLDDADDELIDLIIGNDTVKVLPELLIAETENLDIQNKKDSIIDIRNSDSVTRRYILQKEVFYEVGTDLVDNKYHSNLNSIAQVLIDHPELNVEINGYTDKLGSADANMILSISRARNVMQYLLNNKVKQDQILINGYGEEKAGIERNEEDKQRNRKTVIRVFEIKNE
jgi:outer membrane protein OmpA-like peptidoglycan-associated protein